MVLYYHPIFIIPSFFDTYQVSKKKKVPKDYGRLQ